MKRIYKKLCFGLVAICLSLQAAHGQKVSAIVVFGDSLSDLGNTYSVIGNVAGYGLAGYNSWFYDEGRWTNGPLWIEDVAFALGLPALQRNIGSSNYAYLFGTTLFYGTDFAYGGSRSGDGSAFDLLPNLQTQVGYYLSLLSGTPPEARMPKISETLFSVWSGGNDVIDVVTGLGSSITPAEVAANVGKAIKTLYSKGGRFFFVPNLPPLGDKPSFLNTKYEKPANAFVGEYNPLLQAELAKLQNQLPGVTIIPFDAYKKFQEVLANPKTYGLTNITDSAYVADSSFYGGHLVKNPDQYLFWDDTHPTITGQAIIGREAYKAIQAALGSILASPNAN